ncbi:TRAP transporter substrate-binding protein DctP [Nesterenkonia sp. NBAIMH1]|uniref:TRAP transporter substrate-binding protein DctP n=1 Tax=Nesterenkonia sp. NBAIMH1 TaxID=2600320 RepID=UPI0011B79919|nr:TRAP transporter substrate-binding protein DctP [Nesterenkonia sp. NBAIMH1]
MFKNVKKPSVAARRSAAAIGLTGMLLGLAACGGEGDAEAESVQLNVASWATPDSVSEEMGNWWYEEIEERSEGRLTFNIDAAGSLCSAAEIAECVRDGRADVGQTVTDYSPQLFPQASITSIPFLSLNGEAITRVIYELSTEHEGSQQLWEENGLHPIAHVSPGRLLLGGQEELSSIEDLEGLRLRMAGQYAEQAVDAAGASSVSLTAPETYEALERGVADASGSPLDGTIAFQLKDVLSDWSDPGIGAYTTIGMWMNHDVYTDLPEDLREVVDEVTEEFNREQASAIFNEVTLEQCDMLLDTIGDLRQWDEADTQTWSDELGDSLEERWVEDAEGNGLSNADEYLSAYKDKLDSYEGEVSEDPTAACADR